jgi:tellurite resistance protein TerC
MLGVIEITAWHWAGFVACVLFFLALDLGVFHKSAHIVKFKEAIGWTTVWVALSFLFGLVIGPALVHGWEKQDTVEFVTGYIIELSLSMDNVFVIALIFTYFRVPMQFQHRVLFWGILGALVMRGALIAAGAAVIKQFSWTLYVFGAFLVFTGIKMMFVSDEGVHPEKNPVLRLAKKFFPVTPDFHGQKFSLMDNGKRLLTPAGARVVDGGDNGPRLCARLHPGDLRHHHQTVHRFHLQCVRHPRPALALLRAGGGD